MKCIDTENSVFAKFEFLVAILLRLRSFTFTDVSKEREAFSFSLFCQGLSVCCTPQPSGLKDECIGLLRKRRPT